MQVLHYVAYPLILKALRWIEGQVFFYPFAHILTTENIFQNLSLFSVGSNLKSHRKQIFFRRSV